MAYLRHMKRSLLLLCAIGLFGTAFADNTAAVKKELTADYAKISKGMAAGNVAPISALLTDDYVAIQPGKPKITKAQMLRQFKMLAGQVHVTKWDRTIKSLTASGKTAVAIVNGSFTGEIPSGGAAKPHILSQKGVTKDTWVKTPKGYRLQKSEVQSMEMLMDGQPLPGR
jgi:hypothetical protein